MSTVRRRGRMRVTRDCSKIFAPRATAARASPIVALYGSTLALPCVTRPKPFAPICTEERRPFHRRDVEAGLTPRAVFLLKRLNAVRARAEMDGVANLKAALDAQPFQRRRRTRASRAARSDRCGAHRARHAVWPGRGRTARARAPRCPFARPACAWARRPCSKIATSIPAAASTYAVAQPSAPPPMMATSVCRAPRCRGYDGRLDDGKRSSQ